MALHLSERVSRQRARAPRHTAPDDWNAGFRRLVGQLPPADLEAFRNEHLAAVAKLKTADGLWLDIGVLFAVGAV